MNESLSGPNFEKERGEIGSANRFSKTLHERKSSCKVKLSQAAKDMHKQYRKKTYLQSRKDETT